MIPESLSIAIQNLPQSPGVYQYYDKTEVIIYIGKARNLKKRVSSYFIKEPESGKTRMLVKNIHEIKYIITGSETDALLLENSLIKKHQPKYNINLKDDKTYPWIVITKEPFPRIFTTRQKQKFKGDFFGPYASGKILSTLMELIRSLYPIRNCSLALTKENIASGKFKVCLEYHIKNCKGPCEAYQTEEEYDSYIRDIKHILKGNFSEVQKQLKEQMHIFSDNRNYEAAQEIKEKLIVLENYQTKSTVVNPAIGNVDVFSFTRDADVGYVNYFMVASGSIIQSITIELKNKLDESNEELLTIAITELRNRYQSEAKEIIVPFLPDTQMDKLLYIIPQRGDKKHLLDLSQRNIEYYLFEKKGNYH